MQRAETLLQLAGIGAAIVATEAIGIGMSGLNVRGARDEDGTHTRVSLSDGTTVVLREYELNGMVVAFQAKEVAMFDLLRARDLPAPAVLAEVPGALLLSDGGGQPLDILFREASPDDRPALWTKVGTMLRGLHDIPVDAASFLGQPIYQRPWTKFVPYLGRAIASLAKARPDLATRLRELRALLPAIQEWHDARPRSLKLAGGGQLPGLLLARDGPAWACTDWLSLGYYVSIDDPARDIVHAGLAHREWLGAEVPESLHAAYGSSPDGTAVLVYEMASRLARAKSVGRPERSRLPGPPHASAAGLVDDLPGVVEQLRSVLR